MVGSVSRLGNLQLGKAVRLEAAYTAALSFFSLHKSYGQG